MRRVVKKITVLLLLAAMLLFVSGCGEIVGLEAQSMMSPPRTTADRQAIYALMHSEQSDITLVYPKNGEYRSAVISHDLSKDGILEVASFCINSDAGGIRLQFFEKDENGAWYSLAEFTSAANQVDRVLFGDLTGDGQEEIIVGWGDPLTATASISVYCKETDTMQELPMGVLSYSEMLLTDFDNNGVQELFVLETAGQPDEDGVVTAPLGRLYRFDGERPYEALTVPLDAAVARYSSAVFAKVNNWWTTALIDGVKADGRMITQVVGYDGSAERLFSPLSNAAETPNPTDRAAAVAVTARDINGDGIMEIPTAELIVEQEEGTADSTGYRVTWNTYSLGDDKFTPVCESIVNTAENYFMILPADQDKIACVNDTVTRTSAFFSYLGKSADGTWIGRKDLFNISVYSEEAWAARGEDSGEDILLDSVAGRIYALHILDPSVSAESIVEGFKILNE